jgi:CrcB protein
MSRPAPPPSLPTVMVVTLGGGVGSVLRYGIGNVVHPPHDGFPIATLLINLSGALLLGALVVAVTEVWRVHPLLRPALGTGLLGGYTTFSTFALETRSLPAGVAVSYVAATLVGGLLLAALGMAMVRRYARPGEHGAADPIDPDLP